MTRVQLEQLNVEGLRELARQLGLDTRGLRPVLLERLIEYYERNGWPERMIMVGPGYTENQQTSLEEGGQTQPEMEGQADTPSPIGAQGNSNLQETISAIIQAFERTQRTAPCIVSAGLPRQTTGMTNTFSTDTQQNAFLNWNQVKFTAKLIPPFAGKEDEDIRSWLDRIASIARLYHITDEILILAAVNQLTGRALEWYNRQSIEKVAVWEDFKFQIRSYFERKETFTVTLSRVNARIWKSHVEKFIDYAEDKLKLMQCLKISEKEKIELLADGVKDTYLRKLVLSSWASTIPEFIEYVRKITEDNVMFRRQGYDTSFMSKRSNSLQAKTSSFDGRSNQFTRDRRSSKPTCYTCGQTGHLSPSCPKKNFGRGSSLNQVVQNSSPATDSARSSQSPQPSFSSQSSTSHSGVYAIDRGQSCILVRKLDKQNLVFRALVDTGSPVNLIKKSVYTKFFNNNKLLRANENLNLKGANKSMIYVHGKIHDQISIDNLENQWFDITLLIVDDITMEYDVLLGREFLKESGLRLIYENGKFIFEYPYKNENFTDSILSINAIEENNRYDVVRDNLDKDLDLRAKNDFLNTLEEVDELPVEPIKDDYCVRVHLKDNSLYRYAPRRMSFMEKKELNDITDDLLKRGIIKPSISPYCARIVLVTKKNGKKRMCVDLRPLNQRVSPQKYPFPIIEDQLDQLYGKKVFTKLDLRDGFHQISIHPEDTKYFAFATHSGQFEFTKMPFGYSEAPAEFQKRVIQIFEPMIRSGKILLYIDDILIATVSTKENLQILREVLILLKKYEVDLNLSKCLFLKREIEYLGYLVSEKGIRMSQRHVQAILEYPLPKNLRQLQGFLGLTNYFRKFIKDYALKAKPLQFLTKKNVEFVLTDECINSFELLKQELTSSPVLHIYNPSATTELHTDASSHGFGAILLQKQKTGHMAPIAYFSKSTTDCEKKYHSYELETLAIVKALERFHVYLQGITFLIITDCNSLVLAMKKININPRIARWSLALQNYKFELVHRSSDKMRHVDCLSRNIMYLNAISIEDELLYRQLSDTKLKEIAEKVELHGDKYFTLIDGLLFRNYKDKNLFVVPENMVNNVIRLYHDDMGHVGVDKTAYGILNHYWFPGLKIRIRQYVDNCVKCLSYSVSTCKPEGEMEIFEKNSVPLHTLHLDHFGPLERTPDEYKHILIVIDGFTKFVWLFPTISTSTDEVIENLTSLFNIFGCPERIISDRGTAFSSQTFANFVKDKNIQHVMTAVASPWANGQVERANRFMKSTLSKVVEEPSLWKEQLGLVQFVINNTWNKSIDSTPSKMLLGYEQRHKADDKLRLLIDVLRKVDYDCEIERNKAQETAQIVNRKLQEYNKIQYDKRHKKISKYNEGDLVLIKVLQHQSGTNKKLALKYKGPYQIKAILKKNRFVVTDIPGYNITQKPLNTILSADKLKPWIRINKDNKEDEN